MQNVIKVLVYVVVIIVFWNVLDLAYSSFVRHSAYVFDIGRSLVQPAIIGALFGSIDVLANTRRRR